MAEFANTTVPGRIATLLDQIKRANRPTKVTQGWLESVGLKTKNDRSLIGLLKSLGYTDAGSNPTDKWAELKGSDSDRRASLGRQMAVGYPALFEQFPVETIRELTRDEVKNFVRPRVTAGEPTVDNIASTFLALRGLASLDGAGQPAAAAEPAPVPQPAAARVAATTTPSGVQVTINLSLEIPPTNDADIYEKLFESMARHLGGLMGRES